MFKFLRIYGLLTSIVLTCLCVSSRADAQTIQSIKRASLAPVTNEQGESYSYDPEVDGDGRYVIFTSTADNFAADGKVSGQFHEHVYLRDILSGSTTQLDLTSEGNTGSPGTSFNPNLRVFRSSFHPHLSRDGKYALFTSTESNISSDGKGEEFGNWAYLKNLQTGEIFRIPYATAGDSSKSEYPTYLAINGDGSKAIVGSIISDTDDVECTHCAWELSLYDRALGTTTLINTGVAGNKYNVRMSDDGRFMVFENQVGDFKGPTYSYLYDLELSELTPLNEGKVAISPSISGDGAIIAYTDVSDVTSRIRLRVRATGEESLVSGGLNGEEPDGISGFASLNQDGRYVAFLSTASNLVADDLNGTDDIFVYDRVSGNTTLVSVQGVCNGINTTEDFNTGPPSISADGKTIAFTVLERLIPANQKDSSGKVIEPADTNSFDDVYVATLDYDAQPDIFKKSLTPASPFVSVNCSGVQARFQLEAILASQLNASGHGQKVTIKGIPIKKITQNIIISKISANGARQDLKRLTAKRNRFATLTLPSGNYSARTQAKAVLKNGSSVQTKQSKPANFTISK